MKIKKFLPLIGILIFIYLLINIDLSQVFTEIMNAKTNFLLIAILFIILSIIFQTYKWFIIARKQKINVPFFKALKIQFISSFYGFVTPSRFGQIIRANYLKKYSNEHVGKGVGNFVLEKILDLCSLIFLVIFASFFFKEIVSISYFIPLILFIFFSIMFFIVMSEKYSKIIFKIIERIFGKIIPFKLKEIVKENFYSFHEDKPKKIYFLFFFIINLISWTIGYIAIFFIGKAIGIEIPLHYFILILPVATLISQIPITMSGLGTREITLISLFGLWGIAAPKVFSMSIIAVVLGEIIPSIIGGVLSLQREKNYKRPKKSEIDLKE